MIYFKYLEANVLAQKEEPSSSLDGKSIAIGFVLGVFLTFAGGIIFWFFVRRIYKKKGGSDSSFMRRC